MIVKTSNLTKLIFIFSVLALAVVILNVILPKKANAVSGSEWQAGRIIDDAIFFNKDSMSVAQIQEFLNAKVPVCDRWNPTTFSYAGKPYGPPYTCLKEYQENPTTHENNIGRFNPDGSPYNVPGGWSAAQIIMDASQAYNINPQSLIVMLQKETAIVTDPWSAGWQFDRAMGYACPDSGTNGTANCDTNYYGFYNQVGSAAWQLRRYVTYPDQYNFKAGVTRNILWQVGGVCGSSPVYLENSATAALYNYTPYQPNQAALNNLYGLGDNCSAYGNRNFWRIFNDWFGSTTGTIVRTTSSPSLYILDGSRKYNIPDMNILSEYGFNARDVRYISDFELNKVPLAATPFSSTIGSLVKTENDSDYDGAAVYLVTNNTKFPINSMQQFDDFGFDAQQIKYVSANILNMIKTSGKPLSNYVKAADNSIFKIDTANKRAIFELSKLQSMNPNGNISNLSSYLLNSFPVAAPLVDGNYIISDRTGALRLYNAENYHTVPSLDIYDCLRLKDLKTFKIYGFDIVAGTGKGNAKCIAKDSLSNTYLIDNQKKLLLPNSNNTSPVLLSDSMLSRYPTQAPKKVLKGQTPELSALVDNKIRPLPSMNAFYSLGFQNSDIQVIGQPAYKSLAYGPIMLGSGLTLLEANGSVSIMTSNSTRKAIKSINQFNDFKLNWGGLIRIQPKETVEYPSSGDMYNNISYNGNIYIIDGGVRYLVAPDYLSHFGITAGSTSTVEWPVIMNTLPWTMSRFVKSNSSAAVYYIENGTKRPISSWNKVVEMGGGNTITILTERFINSYPTGSSL